MVTGTYRYLTTRVASYKAVSRALAIYFHRGQLKHLPEVDTWRVGAKIQSEMGQGDMQPPEVERVATAKASTTHFGK